MLRFTPEKGFTLVELLLVVFMIGILGTLAISSYISTVGGFGFISKQKEITAAIRDARNLAVTDKDMSETCGNGEGAKVVTAERYGASIQDDGIVFFADVSPDNTFSLGSCDMIMKEIDLSGTDYELSVVTQAGAQALEFPVSILYERGSGDFSVREESSDAGANTLISKEQHNYIAIKLENTEEDQQAYVLIFQVSGLPEVVSDLDDVL